VGRFGGAAGPDRSLDARLSTRIAFGRCDADWQPFSYSRPCSGCRRFRLPRSSNAGSSCTGWGSTRIPPTSIRVYRTTGPHAGTSRRSTSRPTSRSSWPQSGHLHGPLQPCQSGAVAVKGYGWYYSMNSRGGSGSGGCYDVIDNSNDQVYWPESKSATAGEVAAVEATWYESATRGGSITLTGYRPGNDVACGSDSDGATPVPAQCRNCAAAGMTADQILQTYYGPNVALLKPPVRPAALFLSPGSAEPLTALSSATAIWTEEPGAGTSIASRKPSPSRWLHRSTAAVRWIGGCRPLRPGPQPERRPRQPPASRPVYCYRFVVGLTDSASNTAYAVTGTLKVDPLARPRASPTRPPATIAAFGNPSATVAWTESPAPGTQIATRTLTTSMPLSQCRAAAPVLSGSTGGTTHAPRARSWAGWSLRLLPLAVDACRYRRPLRDVAVRRVGRAGILRHRRHVCRSPARKPAFWSRAPTPDLGVLTPSGGPSPGGVRLRCQMSRSVTSR